jgi:hypothetical protein
MECFEDDVHVRNKQRKSVDFELLDDSRVVLILIDFDDLGQFIIVS